MVFDQEGIEEVIIDHFKGIFGGLTTPLNLDTSEEEINDDIEIQSVLKEDEFEMEVCSPYSTSELDEILDRLPFGKASGTDHIPNELLKNTNSDSRLYLQIFFNKIMQDGEVPETLNQGKCVLLYKVEENPTMIFLL